MTRCFLSGCPNQRTASKFKFGVSFHRIPKAFQKQWLRAIGNDPNYVICNKVICSEYFNLEDFIQKLDNKKRIKVVGTLPSQNLPILSIEGDLLIYVILACQNLHPHEQAVKTCKSKSKSKPCLVVSEKSSVNRMTTYNGDEEVSKYVERTVESEKSTIGNRCCNCNTQTECDNKTFNVPSKFTFKLPMLTPRYHGPGCALEICVLEKHDPQCKYKKNKCDGRNDIDDRSGSYEVIGRLKYKTCEDKALSQKTSVTQCPMLREEEMRSLPSVCDFKKRECLKGLDVQKKCSCATDIVCPKQKRKWYQCCCPCVQGKK